MDASNPDTLAPFLGGRFTRRAAVAAGGAGLAFAAFGLGHSGVAQEATPASPEDAAGGDRTYFLFVQTFHSGSVTPKEGEEGVFLLTLTGDAAQTVYFSDRPERIVGAVSTIQFLDSLGFTPANPPNAALVAQTDAGEDIVVLELFNPIYSETYGEDRATTLTYEVKILADYQEDGLAHLAARQSDAELPEQFGSASLFIDDCADGSVACWYGSDYFVGSIGPMGFCWGWDACGCHPCASESDEHWNAQCNATFAECEGRCNAKGICHPW